MIECGTENGFSSLLNEYSDLTEKLKTRAYIVTYPATDSKIKNMYSMLDVLYELFQRKYKDADDIEKIKEDLIAQLQEFDQNEIESLGPSGHLAYRGMSPVLCDLFISKIEGKNRPRSTTYSDERIAQGIVDAKTQDIEKISAKRDNESEKI